MPGTLRTWIAIVVAGLLSFGSFPSRADDERVSLYIDPQCPRPDETISLWATVGTGFAELRWGMQEVSVRDNIVTFSVGLVDGDADDDGEYDGDAVLLIGGHSVAASVGPLPAGRYQVQLDVRRATLTSGFGVGQIEDFVELHVQDNPPACAARHIIGKTSEMLTARLGQPYSSAFVFQITDAHGVPVDGTFSLERVGFGGWSYGDPPLPDIAGPLVTRRDTGKYELTALADDAPGTFMYRVVLEDVPFRPAAYVVLSNRRHATSLPLVPVVEYVHAPSSHYFMTANFEEMAKLDGHPEWYRTGDVFLAYGGGSAPQPADATPVCRFIGEPDGGSGSHFFSPFAQECEAIRRQAAGPWQLETDNAFGVFLPDPVTGACRNGTRAIYRAFNNRPDANHRYSTYYWALSVIEYPTGPWIREGYGPDPVAMCAPE